MNCKGPFVPACHAAGKGKRQGLHKTVTVKGVNFLSGMFSAFTNALESLFAPPVPQSRAQIEETDKRRENAANDAHEIAWQNYLYDTQQERIDAYRKEQDRQKELEAEQWRKQNERGGRER
jgi:hypothetical protein